MLFMVVSQDFIYYSNTSDGGKLYKMKTDGTGAIGVADDKVFY